MLPRAQKGHKFPRPFVQRRLLFSDEKKGSKFTTFSPPRHCEWRIATASRSPPSRILPFPLLCSVHRLPNFPSFFFHQFLVSFSLFIFIDPRSQSNARYQDRQCATMRQPATVHRSALLIETGDLPKYRVLSRLGRIVSDTHGRATRRRFIFLARSAWKMKRRNQFACYSLRSLPLPSLKLGWWQCAKLETSHRREIRRAW